MSELELYRVTYREGLWTGFIIGMVFAIILHAIYYFS